MIDFILLDAAKSLSSNSFWDPNILGLIDGIKKQLDNALFVEGAKNIAAILSLLYLSVKAYSMILGEGKLEIMPLLRPFLITLVIVNFGLFGRILGSVGGAMENTAQQAFEANAARMDNKLAMKQLKMDSIKTIIDKSSGVIRETLADRTKTLIQNAPGPQPLAGVEAQMSAWLTIQVQLMWTRLSMWLQGIIMWVVIALMKGVMYCLFFMQMIFMHILLILGPMAFAFSIVGAFGSSWIEWVKHFISVSFWGVIGFIVMNIVCAVIAYGLNQEIYRLTAILNNGRGLIEKLSTGMIPEPDKATALFFASVMHLDSFLGFLLIGLITAIGGIAATPLVASWIIGGATNSAMKGMATGGSMIAGAAAGAVSTGVTAATGGVGTIASTVIGAGKKGSSAAGSVAKIAPPPQQPPPSRPS